MNLDVNLWVIVAVVVAVLWAVVQARRQASTPQARAEAAATAAAEQEATAALPAGWSLTEPDRERYGAGTTGVDAYAVVGADPAGGGWAAIALTKAEAYRTLVAALRGDLEEAQAWAPAMPDLPAEMPPPRRDTDIDVVLPSGWTLIHVDFESYLTGGKSLPTYGAMATTAAGKRALTVTREKELAVPRLIDHLEGRLPITQGWVFRLPPS